MIHNPDCEICRNNKPFEIPGDLYESLKDGKLVIFAGAGVSTESTNVFPYSLYDELCDDIGIDPKNCKLLFPDLVSLFEQQDNGRRKLLAKIRGRVQYIKSFIKLFTLSTRFHHELADIHQIDEIITTNWDDFFEIVCDAVPFVISKDFVFWEIPERKVFKIHGSINNLSTIIASKSDYEKCRKELSQGVIGSYLRVLLATKTIVYCGYAFNDPDFLEIHEILTKEMNEILPHAYMVTLDKHISEKIGSFRITPILTDATFFLHSLKEKLIADEIINSPEIYRDVIEQLAVLRNIHTNVMHTYDIKRNPSIIYTYSYQDGLLDALERGLTKHGTGEYLCQVFIENNISNYLNIMKKKEKERKYWDVAYIEGYIRGLMYFITPKSLRSQIPYFYIMGRNEMIFDKERFDKLLKNEKSYDAKVYRSAVKLYQKRFTGEDIIPEHTPFLL
jgi:hypothetical protein